MYLKSNAVLRLLEKGSLNHLKIIMDSVKCCVFPTFGQNFGDV